MKYAANMNIDNPDLNLKKRQGKKLNTAEVIRRWKPHWIQILYEVTKRKKIFTW